MKKILGYKFMFAAALLMSLASCNDDDNATETMRTEKANVTFTVSSTNVVEGQPIEITMTTDRALKNAMEFKLSVLSTASGNFREFTVPAGTETTPDSGFGLIGYQITMPAYTTTYTFTIVPDVDFDIEGTEVFNFRLEEEGNSRGLIAEANRNFTVNVADYVSSDVGVELVWDGSTANWFGTIEPGTYLGADGERHDLTAFDFDIYVFDGSGTTEVTEFAGATSNSPESVIIPSTLPDGEYLIIADFYDAPGDEAQPFALDVTMNITKFGVWSVSLPLEYMSDGGTSAAAGGLGDGVLIPAILIKTGTTYELLDADTNETLAQGRMASVRSKIAANKLAKGRK
ncbi:hypothetical protein [Flavobacterium selenitireducens]|uniref:hypothetical protein n=1 Tax=Flavobacterium selenitireducens TaxID=2722704 RepID=UPI00168AEA7F|nr:hypothetical protein [Flavobacterium selenitireducens]MBD3583394.1 hypothetical protein [Flavobacterium selenitireducens]